MPKNRDIPRRRRSSIRVGEARALLDAVPDAALIVDAQSLRAVFANAALSRLTGRPARELIGEPLWRLLSPPDEGQALALAGAAVRRGETRSEAALALDGDDSAPVTLTLKPYAARGEAAGAPSRLLAVLRDRREIGRMEAQVRHVSERLALAAGSADIGIFEWDLLTDEMTWDATMRRLYGLPEGEGCAEYDLWRSMVHPDDIEHAETMLAGALEGDVVYVTGYRIVRPDGEVRHIAASAAIERDASGQPTRVLGVNLDETERKRAERLVIARERELQRILDAIPAFVFFKDDENTILRVNKPAADSLGKPVSVLEGIRTEDVFPAEQAAAFLADDLEVLSSGVPKLGIVERYTAADGVVRIIQTDKIPLIDDHGELRRLVAIATDITEARRTEQRLRLAMEASHQGVWDWHIQTGETFFNDEFYTMIGYEPGAFPMRMASFETLVHPEDLPRLHEEVDRHFRGEVSPYRCKVRLKTASGEWKWVQDVGELTDRDEAGRPSRMIGLHIDIDEETRAKEELAAAREAAEAASRAKSDFLANMSHELRTPMTAILGYADLLGTDEVGTDASHRGDAVGIIRRNGEHLLTLINDILDLSKIEAGKMTVEAIGVDPAAVVADVVSLLEIRASAAGLKLSAEHEGELPAAILSDPVRLRQIVANLVGNAIKFTERGGVTVRLGFEPGEDGRGTLSIAIADTGIGMTEAQLGKLFESFSQADTSTTRKYGGTGLGLRISRRLAEIMGGSIGVASQPGKGSTFTVRLDVATAEAAPGSAGSGTTGDAAAAAGRPVPQQPLSPPPPAATDGPPLAGRRVLVAEDGPDNQRLIAFFLKKAGAEVEMVDNGLKAVEALARSGCPGVAGSEEERPFELLLLDMQMPVMSGYEAAAEIRSRGMQIPIIALTAHAMRGDERRCLDAGCDDYQTKPIDRKRLIDACAGWVSGARRRDAA